MNVIRKRIYEILEASRPHDRAAKVWTIFISAVIVVNVVAVALSTVKGISRWSAAFLVIESVSVSIFLVEYALRVWSVVESPNFRHPVWGRFRFVTTPLAVIDLLAILPFFLRTGLDLRVIRMLRLFRLLSVLKLARYSHAVTLIRGVVYARRAELAVAASTTVILIFVAGSIMYYVENPVQPDKFSSVPTAIWWAVVTVTTVGYGDIFPVTTVGRIIGSLVTLVGIAAIAFPTSILGAGFLAAFESQTQTRCATCGAPTTRSVVVSTDDNPPTFTSIVD